MFGAMSSMIFNRPTKMYVLQYSWGITEIDMPNSHILQRDIEVPADQNGCDEPDIKRSKSNVCIECLGLFQNDYLNTIAKEIVEKTELNSYECDTIYTSISVPILIQIRELALWIHLLKQLPGKISESMLLLITLVDVFKIHQIIILHFTFHSQRPSHNN